MPARGGRRINRRKDWVPLSRFSASHFYKDGTTAQIPLYDEFTFSVWVRVHSTATGDGTIVQWVWQEDFLNQQYWQIFRLRWFNTVQKLSVEVFDPEAYGYIMSSNHRPFSFTRGKLVHLHGYWNRYTGFVGTQNGVLETTTVGAVGDNDIQATYSNWHAVGGGQDFTSLGFGPLNQLSADVGPTWVGFNQNRPVTDFLLNSRPVPLPEDGNLGTGVPEFYFNGTPEHMNARAGFSRVANFQPTQRASP